MSMRARIRRLERAVKPGLPTREVYQAAKQRSSARVWRDLRPKLEEWDLLRYLCEPEELEEGKRLLVDDTEEQNLEDEETVRRWEHANHIVQTPVNEEELIRLIEDAVHRTCRHKGWPLP